MERLLTPSSRVIQVDALTLRKKATLNMHERLSK